MKRILFLLACFFTVSCFSNTDSHFGPKSCPQAPPVSEVNFCSQFKAIASCHCQADGGLPAGMCSDMNVIYDRMIATFKTQQSACEWQHKNSVPYRAEVSECMDDWDCYRTGNYRLGKCSTLWNKCI
jgi:hypothetical protein